MAAGLSREEFAKLVCYAPGTIRAFETGDRFPSPPLIKGADEHLTVEVSPGQFSRMQDNLLRRDVYPEWFRPWVDVEREATALWTFELSVIPGLLKTEDYARALLGSGNGDTEAKVAARMERQEVLSKENPPTFVALIDEGALRRTVGDREVMARQLCSLAEAADQSIIQVVPFNAGMYRRLDGSFMIATMHENDVVYVPMQPRGYIFESPEILREVRWRWEAIRAEALPRGQSRDLILRLADNDT